MPDLRMRLVSVFALCLLLLAMWPLSALAQDVSADTAYMADRWTTADGLPVNAINQVHVGRDGYLWLATFDGLVRFDGHRFTVFGQDQGLPGHRLMLLEEDAEGGLWLLSEQNVLARLHGGRFHTLGVADGLPDARVHTMGLDEEGWLWAGTMQGLVRWRDGRFERGDGGQVLEQVNAAVFDPPSDRFTVATGHAVFQFQGERLVRHLAVGEQLPAGYVNDVAWQGDTLWVAMNEGMVAIAEEGIRSIAAGESFLRVVAGDGRLGMIGPRAGRWIGADGRERAESYPLHPANGRETLLAYGRDGARWENHLDRLERNGRPVLHTRCTIKDFDFDEAGAVWVATACDGLWRLRPRRIHATTELDGMALGSVYGLAQTPSGEVWVATLDHGMAVLHPDGAARWLGEEADFVGSSLRTVYPDPQGGLWIGQPGLCRMHGEACLPPPGLPDGLQSPNAHIRAIHRAADGALWVGSVNGLFRHDAMQGWQSMFERAGLAPAQDTQIRAVAETADGTLWFGMYGAGMLRRWPDGRFERIGTEHGLTSLAVRALRLDTDGQLWVATENRGLCLARAPQEESVRLSCVDRRHGLWSESLHQVLFDAHDRLWLNSNHGVFLAPRAAYLAVLDGRAARVHPQVFTERDGLPSREGNGGVQDAGIVLADGRLVFPTQDGIALFDPDDLPASVGAPRAVFQSLLLPDGRSLDAAPEMTLAPGERSFTLHYTGLSPALTAPVYFRYRLATDPQWVELGDVRQFGLSRLPPGAHRVELQAFDSSGATGEPVRLHLHIPAHWYETGAFRIAAPFTLVLIALGWLMHLRHRSQQRQRQLAVTVAERTVELRDALATVSDQRNRIEQLARTQARFFANVSHELRTPLTLLVGPLEDLARGHAPSPALANAMTRNARRLQRLIDQLLDLERIQSGRFPLRPCHLDLVQLTQESLVAFAPLAQREGIALDAHLPAVPAHAIGDAEQLMRLIGNLLSNALKFCPAGGRVRLALHTDAAGTRLCVDDNGPGVPDHWRERIFNRFSQMGSDATRQREGAGLGLALCREVAHLHGGRLYATDSSLGGASFVLELPLPEDSPLSAREPGRDLDEATQAGPHAQVTAQRAQAPASAETGAISGHSVERESDQDPAPSRQDDRPLVLLAEDNPDLRAYLTGVLSAHYRVTQAEDGDIALEHARTEPPDLIVTDLMMPNLDGLGLAQAIRAEAELSGVPIVFLTARASDVDRIAGLSGGADYYLIKPFDPRVLLAQLDAALRACQRLRRHFAERPGAAALPAAPESPARPESDFARRLRNLLDAQSHEPDFGVARMCTALHLSESSLRRRCQNECGARPGDLLREHRLLRARHLLSTSAGSVSEVAYAVGYASLSAFSRAYRERFGSAPSRL